MEETWREDRTVSGAALNSLGGSSTLKSYVGIADLALSISTNFCRILGATTGTTISWQKNCFSCSQSPRYDLV